jgi:putative chitinase
MITTELLVKCKICDQGAAQKWAPYLQAAAEKFHIDTPERVAGWLAQCAHESNNFRDLSENMNYSADGLLKTFPKYFNKLDVALYARKPEKIANKVYADRMGNGPESSGDGWKYRGRGLIGLTGKTNYRMFGKDVGQEDEVLSDPDKLVLPKYATLSAGWFWAMNGLNQLADAKDIVGMSKRVNGGTIGLDHRKQLYTQICKALSI